MNQLVDFVFTKSTVERMQRIFVKALCATLKALGGSVPRRLYASLYDRSKRSSLSLRRFSPYWKIVNGDFQHDFLCSFFYLKEMGLFIKDRKEIWQLKGVIAINELEVLETSKLEVK